MFTVKEILDATKGKLLSGDSSAVVKGISIDSRTFQKGEGYIAIKGKRLDGHRFIKAVAAKGANLFVVSKKIRIPSNLPIILVKDTTVALGHIARLHRRKFSIPVIAVTGSAGKTTTKELIAQVLSAKYSVLKNHKTENNQYGVSLTLLRMHATHQVAVLELGTNQKGEIRQLSQIVEPTICVYTNVGASHLEGLKSVAGVFQEKLQMTRYLRGKGPVIYNGDDPHLQLIPKRVKSKRLKSFSIVNRSSFQAQDIKRRENAQITFRVGKTSYTLNTMSVHNVYNALAAIICGDVLRISPSLMKIQLQQFSFSNSRAQLKRNNGYMCIDDTYNANPVSFRSAIETLTATPVKGKRLLICADMLELGNQAEYYHRWLGELISHSNIDVCLTYGRYARTVHETIRKLNKNLVAVHCRSTRDVNTRLSQYLQPGDCLLVKGSRGMKMEDVVANLAKE